MSIVYTNATLVPGKIEMVTGWMQHQRWYAGKGHVPTLHRVGGYRFDDPEGEVGLETLLLAMAMFALGAAVRVAGLRKVGLRPFAMAAVSTVWVATLALTGILLVA